MLIIVGRARSIVVMAPRIRRRIGNVVRWQLAALARFLRARVWRENSFLCERKQLNEGWEHQADNQG